MLGETALQIALKYSDLTALQSVQLSVDRLRDIVLALVKQGASFDRSDFEPRFTPLFARVQQYAELQSNLRKLEKEDVSDFDVDELQEEDLSDFDVGELEKKTFGSGRLKR